MRPSEPGNGPLTWLARIVAALLARVPQVAARLQPSVVTLLAGSRTGSGVVYTADGLILTNEHMVRGQRAVQVAFADGKRVAGTVRAVDPVIDLALVQAERRNLSPARFQTRLPAVGSLAVVIGSPLGFENSVTAGIVSGLHREVPGDPPESRALVDLIQTDAPMSPGNSGGAVANAAGEVVGITLTYIPPQEGAVAIGFAIPASTVLEVAGQLRRSGQARHAFAGLEPAPITPEVAPETRLGRTDGFVVAAAVPPGPADRAGPRPGDTVTAVDAHAAGTPEASLAAVRQKQPGDL
jgi:S1-C subfamily serine protease